MSKFDSLHFQRDEFLDEPCKKLFIHLKISFEYLQPEELSLIKEHKKSVIYILFSFLTASNVVRAVLRIA